METGLNFIVASSLCKGVCSSLTPPQSRIETSTRSRPSRPASSSLTPPQSRIETGYAAQPPLPRVPHSPRHSRGLRPPKENSRVTCSVPHSPRHSRGLRRGRTRHRARRRVPHSPRHSRGLRPASSAWTGIEARSSLTPPQSRIETDTLLAEPISEVPHSPRHSRGLRPWSRRRAGRQQVPHSPRHSRGLRRRCRGHSPGRVPHSPRHSRGLRLISLLGRISRSSSLTPPQSRIETPSLVAESAKMFLTHPATVAD